MIYLYSGHLTCLFFASIYFMQKRESCQNSAKACQNILPVKGFLPKSFCWSLLAEKFLPKSFWKLFERGICQKLRSHLQTAYSTPKAGILSQTRCSILKISCLSTFSHAYTHAILCSQLAKTQRVYPSGPCGFGLFRIRTLSI